MNICPECKTLARHNVTPQGIVSHGPFILETRPAAKNTVNKRRYDCHTCGERFTTYERTQEGWVEFYRQQRKRTAKFRRILAEYDKRSA